MGESFGTYIYVVVIAVVVIGLFIYQRVMIKARGQQTAHLTAGAIASRFGLSVVKGDPSFNFAMHGQAQSMREAEAKLRGVSRTEVQVAGNFQGVPLEFLLDETIAYRADALAVYQQFESRIDCRISVYAQANSFPEFEITMRAKGGFEPEDLSGAPVCSFGDAALDQKFVVRCADPQFPVKIASAVRALGDSSCIAIVGDPSNGRIAERMNWHTLNSVLEYHLDAVNRALIGIAMIASGHNPPA